MMHTLVVLDTTHATTAKGTVLEPFRLICCFISDTSATPHPHAKKKIRTTTKTSQTVHPPLSIVTSRCVILTTFYFLSLTLVGHISPQTESLLSARQEAASQSLWAPPTGKFRESLFVIFQTADWICFSY